MSRKIAASSAAPDRAGLGYAAGARDDRARKNGLLSNFFDAEALADAAERVLDASADYKHLGRAGSAMIAERYSLDVSLPRMLHLYEDALGAHRPAP